MAREIPLTQGKVAIVDDEDYDVLAKNKWMALKSRKGVFYAARMITVGYKKQNLLRMHCVILPPTPGMTVDHIDRDGLNNRRSNLRLANGSQQRANRSRRDGCRSKYRGVTRHRNKWYARITKDGARIDLGLYHIEEDAARAYDAAAAQLHGEFANLNFPNQRGLINV